MELLTTPYHFLSHFFLLAYSIIQNVLVNNLAVVKLLTPKCSHTAENHHTLTLMFSKGQEIKIAVLGDNWQSDSEIAPETVELPTRKWFCPT